MTSDFWPKKRSGRIAMALMWCGILGTAAYTQLGTPSTLPAASANMDTSTSQPVEAEDQIIHECGPYQNSNEYRQCVDAAGVRLSQKERGDRIYDREAKECFNSHSNNPVPCLEKAYADGATDKDIWAFQAQTAHGVAFDTTRDGIYLAAKNGGNAVRCGIIADWQLGQIMVRVLQRIQGDTQTLAARAHQWAANGYADTDCSQWNDRRSVQIEKEFAATSSPP